MLQDVHCLLFLTFSKKALNYEIQTLNTQAYTISSMKQLLPYNPLFTIIYTDIEKNHRNSYVWRCRLRSAGCREVHPVEAQVGDKALSLSPFSTFLIGAKFEVNTILERSRFQEGL